MSFVHPAVGATYLPDHHCNFTVWAPRKTSVEIIVNNIPHRMEKGVMGYWSVTVPNVSPGAEYTYQLDGQGRFPDPASRSQPSGVHGPSSVVSNDFEWNDSNWRGLELREMIIYELHVGTFTKEGTFEGVISKLPYLRELGINTIELMPVAQFPGSRNWGYDGVLAFAVQESYGGALGLKKLIDAAHAHEIAVVLDVVYNHFGPEGNFLPQFGPYFTEKYKTPWGKAVNFDDEYCDGVRNYFLQNALMWLDEFRMDGLRLDAVHSIWDSSANHFVKELNDNVRQLEISSGRKKVLIAEFDLNNPRYVSAIDKGGYGLDGQWVDEFHHALHSVVTGEKSGYYEDFGDLRHLSKSFRDSYVYTGEYSVHRKRSFGVNPAELPYSKFVVFAQNHDQIGNRMLGDRLSTQLSFEGLKLTAAAYLLSPHVPMLFMGEEYGEKNPFQYFISHGDDNLVEAIRKGRKEEFSKFSWSGDVPDPQAEKTFLDCKLSWSFEMHDQSLKLLNYYKYLIRFRKSRQAMKGEVRSSVQVHDIRDKNILAFERDFADDKILVILNFEKHPWTFHIPSPGIYKKIFDSSESDWGGPGHSSVVNPNTIELNPESAIIIEIKK
jgi:maltooligosyltrehalose trehalohydrolase